MTHLSMSHDRKTLPQHASSSQVRERSHMTSAAEGGGGFEMLTVADKGGGGGGLSLADVSKNTKILAKIVSNQACLTLCVRLLH